jgi:hypothetical protein
MYTLLELESKTFGALKKIGYELNVLPEGDRRYRQSWIDAIAGVNPPLLALLEVSPAGEVQAQEPILEMVENAPGVEVDPRQEPIAPVAENSPGVEVDPRQEPIAQAAENSPGVEVDPRQELIEPMAENPPGVEVDQLLEERIEEMFHLSELEKLDEPNCPACGGFYSLVANWSKEYAFGFWIISCLKCDASITCSIEELPRCFGDEDDDDDNDDEKSKNSPGVEVDPVQNLIMGTVETSPGVDLVKDELPECSTCFGDGYVEDEFGLVKFCQCEARLSHQRTQRVIAPVPETSPGVEVSFSDRQSYWADRGFFLIPEAPAVPEKNPAVEFEGCIYCTSPEYESWRDETYRCYRCEPEPDLNPILTGIPLSDRFLARYSPPQSGNICFQVQADGQLSLLDFEVQSEPEPPDRDDFESLDAFREAIARWDEEHLSDLDHFSNHLPRSVHSEPLEISLDVSSEDNALGVPLDSFCLWAHCPADWYEPAALLELSKVLELSPTCKNSITSDFFIPTFGSLGDRSNGIDEPPDTGIFAWLPKPKPPNFPPQSASWTQVGHKLDTSQSGIPKLFHRVAAGSSTQPARSPPGGDSM